ncbi:MAG TPA: ERAP1-like C-terminal domain-containing protein, partial [Nocardioides sp.]|nr:ERAP1-like C-terminal domain-containing protein [Nocardioides sp.]
VNTVRPEFTLDEDGTYASLRIHQSASPEHPTLRRHRMGIGLYDLIDGALVRRTGFEVDVEGEFTDVAAAVGQKQPDLLLLNDEDLAYVKVRLDERSYDTAVAHLSKLDDSLARALIWTAAWDMCRDGELPTADYLDLVLANIGQETDSWALSRIPVLAESALFGYLSPEKVPALQERWEAGLRELLVAAEPGSDAQLIFAKTYAAASDTARGSIHGCMRGDQPIADVKALLDGSWELPGLKVDQDLRWRFITGLCAAGAFGEAEIAAELERDTSQSGKENAAGARAASPDPALKAEAWRLVMLDPSTPNATGEAIANEFSRAGQPALDGYLQAYLDAADSILENIGTHRAARAMEYIFPRSLATEANLELIDRWLATTTAGALGVRYVREGRDELARGLKAQQA